MKIKNFIAAKAFIVHDGKVLILRESSEYEDGTIPGLYDVPGGRIKDEQSLEEGLIREIEEETGLDCMIGDIFHEGEWQPVVRGEQWIIKGTFFECKADSNIIKLSQDHDHYEWIDPKEYNNHNIHPPTKKAFKVYLKFSE